MVRKKRETLELKHPVISEHPGSITRNVTRLLEEVYCGRNFTTKIFHMPSLLRAIVNSLIPEDKKSKVELLAKSQRLFEHPAHLDNGFAVNSVPQ